MNRFHIGSVTRTQDLDTIVELFREYAASLPVDLSYQNFDQEVRDVLAKYGPPRGALLLARAADGTAAGCVALRPLAADRCEMKRLYVAPAARGTGLGRALVEAIIGEARSRGYRELFLDTLPTMNTAIGLYRQLGFRDIEPYYPGAPPGTVYLALGLDRDLRTRAGAEGQTPHGSVT
jgi:ribosomal protein S18 acetylase RimI-like enzyme